MKYLRVSKILKKESVFYDSPGVFEIEIVEKKNIDSDRMIGNEPQNRFKLVYVQQDWPRGKQMSSTTSEHYLYNTSSSRNTKKYKLGNNRGTWNVDPRLI